VSDKHSQPCSVINVKDHLVLVYSCHAGGNSRWWELCHIVRHMVTSAPLIVEDPSVNCHDRASVLAAELSLRSMSSTWDVPSGRPMEHVVH
jgi:hypothetical protein